MSSYQSLVASISSAVDVLNQSRQENKIDNEAVERRLLDLTGGDLASCAHVKFEDLGGLKLPDAFLRRIVDDIIRPAGRKASGKDVARPAVGISSFQATRMGIPDLVMHMARDPFNVRNQAVVELQKLVRRDTLCVVFGDNGQIDEEATAARITAIVENRQVPRLDRTGGKVREVFALGVRPEDQEELHPLFEGQVLNYDGTGESDPHCWSKLGDDVRRLLTCAVKSGEIEKADLTKTRLGEIYRIAQDGFDATAALYQESLLTYRRSEREGNLPQVRRLRRSEDMAHRSIGATRDAFSAVRR